MDQEQLERGQQWLEALLSRAGFPAQVRVEQPDPSVIQLDVLGDNWLTIDPDGLSPEQIQELIGPEGRVIDAMQYLINTILNLGMSPEQQAAYTIELVNYRANRYGELVAMIERVAGEVRRTGNEVEMPPLSAAERRLIHTVFKQSPDLETFSRGQEPHRRLVVRPWQAVAAEST